MQLHHRTSGADVPRGVRCQNLKIEYQVCVANLEAKQDARFVFSCMGRIAVFLNNRNQRINLKRHFYKPEMR